MGKGCWALSGCLGAEACSGQESGVYCMACGGGERFRERSQLCERQNSIAQDAAAASAGASVSQAASLPLSLFYLPSTQLESAHAPAPQEELSCFSSSWWLAGLWRRGFASGTGPWSGPGGGLHGHRHAEPCS